MAPNIGVAEYTARKFLWFAAGTSHTESSTW